MSITAMVSVTRSPWFCTLRPTNGGLFQTKANPRNCAFIALKASSSASGAKSTSPNMSNSLEKSPEVDPAETDPVKLAFAKAKAYKKAIQSNPSTKIGQNPVSESAESRDNKEESVLEVLSNDSKLEVPESVEVGMEKTKEYKKAKGAVMGSNETVEKTETFPDNEPAQVDSKNNGPLSEGVKVSNQDFPTSVKVAMERAKEYKKNKGVVNIQSSSELISELRDEKKKNVETRDFIKKTVDEKKELKISKMDFIGLEFSDKKKSRGLPAGLVPLADPLPEVDLPEVEIIVGDTSKFGNATLLEPKLNEEDKSDMYKPKVSTWGVFPRPGNISKMYGGGRTIRPGEALETAEDRAAKEARTKELLAQYKRKTGLKIDPKLRYDCKTALKDGDILMELGKLKEALPFYEQVMAKLVFQSELHGLAALQWSICQDSLSRQNEARVMYERLQSHPNSTVSKKAKQFLYGFQAMEMMKVKSMNLSASNMGYQNYFEAFIEDKANYQLKDSDADKLTLKQVLPYVAFLVSPIFFVLLIALTKGT